MYDAVSVHRALSWLSWAVVASGCPPTPPPLPALTSPAHAACEHLWLWPSPQRGRPEGTVLTVSEQHLAMKGEHWEINTPDSLLLIWNDLSIFYPLMQHYPTGLTLVAHSGKLLDYMLLILGTSLCSPIIILSWDHLPEKLLAFFFFFPNSCFRIQAKANWLLFLVFWGQIVWNVKMLLSFLICCYTFCLILCHIPSMLPGYILFQNRHGIINKPPWPRRHKWVIDTWIKSPSFILGNRCNDNPILYLLKSFFPRSSKCFLWIPCG